MVSDVSGLAASLAARGVAAVSPVQRLRIGSQGESVAFSIIAPDGVWLEFVEPLS